MCSLLLSCQALHTGHSLWVCMRWSCCVLEDLVSLVSYNPIPPSFCLLFPGFPEPWGKGFYRDIPLRTKCSKVSHSLQCPAVISVFVTIYHSLHTAQLWSLCLFCLSLFAESSCCLWVCSHLSLSAVSSCGLCVCSCLLQEDDDGWGKKLICEY